MTMTFQLPDELAAFLPQGDAEMAAVMSAGLKKWRGAKLHQVDELADVLEFLANLPSPEEVLAMRPAESLTRRTSALLAKSKKSGLTDEEQSEWDQIMKLEHIMRVAKAKAAAMQVSAARRPA